MYPRNCSIFSLMFAVHSRMLQLQTNGSYSEGPHHPHHWNRLHPGTWWLMSFELRISTSLAWLLANGLGVLGLAIIIFIDVHRLVRVHGEMGNGKACCDSCFGTSMCGDHLLGCDFVWTYWSRLHNEIDLPSHPDAFLSERIKDFSW